MPKQRRKKEMKGTRGITLLALIITIIVLLILAAVTILTLTGENGILTNAKNAKKQTIQKTIEEKERIYRMEYEIANGDIDLRDDDQEEYQYLKGFITKWKVNEGETITLPIQKLDHLIYDFTVDYGDGTINKITDVTENVTHTYKKAGEYEVTIEGICQTFSFPKIPESKDKIVGIKQWGATGFKDLSFSGCSNLAGEIPIPVKNSFKEVESFNGLFHSCSKLTGKIPANLFYHAPKAVAFWGAFLNCYNLTGTIPENLFKHYTNIVNVSSLFQGCTNITGEIPPNLFKGHLVRNANVISIFRGCGITKIPANLFEGVDVIDLAFTFAGTNIEEIPEDLLANFPNLEKLAYTFSGCQNLKSIPPNLFRNNSKINYFGYTFSQCINLEGIVPELWNIYPLADGNRCFLGCPKIENRVDNEWFL